MHRSAPTADLLGGKRVTDELTKLGAKDFITGCLIIIVALFVVPILVLMFKISIYLAVMIGAILAIILGVALLGRVIRIIFFRSRSDDQNGND
jgi:hypothetical protein